MNCYLGKDICSLLYCFGGLRAELNISIGYQEGQQTGNWWLVAGLIENYHSLRSEVITSGSLTAELAPRSESICSPSQ